VPDVFPFRGESSRVKEVKSFGITFFFDADARITDRYLQDAGFFHSPQFYAAMFSELHRIAHEVQHTLKEPFSVAYYAETFLGINFNLKLFLLRVLRDYCYNIFKNLIEFQLLEINF